MTKNPLLILLSFVGLLIFSCAKNSGDESLSTEEYLARGLPPIDSAWGVDEYGQCKEVLESVTHEEFKSLPQLQSSKSGEVFKRMTSPDNIEKLYAKRGTGREFLNSYQEIILVYLGEGETESEPYYHKELVELLILLTKYSDYGFLHVKKTIANEMVTPEAKSLIGQMIDGYKREIVNLLTLQTEVLKFTESDLLKLSHTSSESLLHQLEFMDTTTRNEIADAITKLLQKTNSTALKESYSKVLEKLGN